MQAKFCALRWALEMTQFWKLASPDKRFPVDVEAIAMEVSRARYPKDPLKGIKGGDLPGFEGALYPLGNPRDGWGIIYNDAGISPGRKRFTIAHEYGHYLAHRHMLPEGVKCDSKAITRRDGAGIEKEADEFRRISVDALRRLQRTGSPFGKAVDRRSHRLCGPLRGVVDCRDLEMAGIHGTPRRVRGVSRWRSPVGEIK